MDPTPRLQRQESEPEATAGSVTRWVDELKAGRETAVYELWQRYFQRLVGLAQDKLAKISYRSPSADGEDVAQSAFISLWDGASHGRFDQLGDRDDLWRLLVVITSRKASDVKQRGLRKKRGAGRVLDEAALAQSRGAPPSALSVWDLIETDEPTPEFAAMLAEEYERRLNALGRDDLKRIAMLRMEGYSNEEIAARLGCALRTVARRLDLIRQAWSNPDWDDHDESEEARP